MKVTNCHQTLTSNLSLHLSQHSATSLENSDEQWSMRKSQFYATVTPIMAQLAQLQQKLQSTSQQLQKALQKISVKEQEKRLVEEQCERLRLILPLKEQMIRREHSQVERLTKRIKMLERQKGQKKGVGDMRGLDCQSDMSVSEFDGGRSSTEHQRRLRARQMSTQNISHQSHLQSARLRNQNQKLSNSIQILTVQLKTLKIENQHLNQQCKIARNREQQLTDKLERLLLEQYHYDEEGENKRAEEEDEVQSWSARQRGVEKFVDRVVHNQKKSRESEKGHMHPPTPHFSAVSCGFAKKRDKYSLTTQAFFPSKPSSDNFYPHSEQVSLGDLEPTLS